MQDKFYLEFENEEPNVLVQIDEPTQWADITLNLKTDNRQMFGRNFSFSNENIALIFESDYDTIKHGHQFEKLITYFKTYGTGATVNFHYENCDTILLIGQLNFKGIQTDYCSFIDINIIQKKESNLLVEQEDTNADIKNNLTLNGIQGTTIPFEDFKLKSKLFQESAEQEVQEFLDVNGVGLGYYEEFFNDILSWGNLSNGGKSGYTYFFNLDVSSDISIDNNLFYGGNEGSITQGDYSFSFSKNFTNLEVDININAESSISASGDNADSATYEIRLLHRDFEGNIKSETTLFTKNNPNTTFSNLETFNVLVSYNYTFSNITKGDTLTLYTYIYVNIANDPLNSKDANLKNKIYTDSYFKVVGNSIEEDTVHKIPRLKDVFSKIVDFVTDNKVSVSMPEFEAGGEYYDYFLTNGYEIRKAGEVQERQFVYDFKRAIESLNTIFCAGYQLLDNQIFIGTVKEFYKPLNMGLLDYPVVEFTAQYDTEFVKNLFKMEYKKFPKDELNTIDEFNTKAEYSFPSEKIKGTLKKESDFIASGYLIELERRKHFKDTQTESSTYDDEVFIIDAVENGFGGFENRTDENIGNIQNLISSETSYNISLNPLQNLSRWYRYIGSVLNYTTESNVIKTTKFEHNEFFECSVDDSSTLSTTQKQKDNFDKSVFPTHIFEPIIIDTTLINLKLSNFLQIKDEIVNSRGFYEIKDKKGNLLEVFVLDMEYTPAKYELELKCIKKNKDYV